MAAYITDLFEDENNKKLSSDWVSLAGDDCFEDLKQERNKKQVDYKLYGRNVGDRITTSSGYFNDSSVGIPLDRVEIEHKLKSIHVKNSKCNMKEYLMSGLDTNLTFVDAPEPKQTKAKRSCNQLKNADRFEKITRDVQNINHIPKNSVIGTDTRLKSKDFYDKKFTPSSSSKNRFTL
jgi:hypothetical protein